MKTVLISDSHGCIDELNDLFIKIDYKNSNIIMLGDLLDRGPDSVGVVKRCRELGIRSVLGNHDHKFIKWYNSRGSRSDVYDKKDYYDQFNEDDINYIFQMQPYIELPQFNTVIVHAGIKPGIAISKQSKTDLMYLRYTDVDRNQISLKKISKAGGIENAGAKFWTEFGPFDHNIIYGHQVHSLENIRIDSFDNGTACYGIDTGCCFGGRLTAFIVETKEVVQVQAKETYCEVKYNL